MIVTITLNPAIDRTLVVDRPLTPNAINRALSSHREPGGKGINVSRAVVALGGETVALGFCGGVNGRILKDAMTSMNIVHDFVDVASQTRTNIKIIDHHGNSTEINERGDEISEADYLRFLDRMEGYLDKKNVFVVTGSLPPAFPMHQYRMILQKISQAGCRLVINVTDSFLVEALNFSPDFVKINELELAHYVAKPATVDPEQVAENAKALLDAGAQAVCVSMGANGAVFVWKNESEALYVNTDTKMPDNASVGAGDAVVGSIAHIMERGLDRYELAKFSFAAGRASAQLPGTQMASLIMAHSVYEDAKLYVI